MITWRLRYFPGHSRTAVTVLVGRSEDELREAGRLSLDPDEMRELAARLADKPAAAEWDAPRGSVQPPQEGGKP